jgi:hypothetical protein
MLLMALKSSLWKAQLLGCSAARLLSFLHWEVPDVGPEITGMGIIKISMRFLGPQWATKDTSKDFKRCKPAHMSECFCEFHRSTPGKMVGDAKFTFSETKHTKELNKCSWLTSCAISCERL